MTSGVAATTFAVSFLAFSGIAATTLGAGYVPANGFVPTAEVAVKIARAVLIPIYGERAIEREEPLTAELRGDEWEIKGTFHCPVPNTCAGGVAEISISKKDGRILRVIHGQ